MGVVVDFLNRTTETPDCIVVPRHPTTQMKMVGAHLFSPASMDFSHHLYEMVLQAADRSAWANGVRVMRIPSQMTSDMRQAAVKVLSLDTGTSSQKRALAEKVFGAMVAARPL